MVNRIIRLGVGAIVGGGVGWGVGGITGVGVGDGEGCIHSFRTLSGRVGAVVWRWVSPGVELFGGKGGVDHCQGTWG